MLKLPSIEVVFKQKATSLIERSTRGIAILIVKDDTVKDDEEKNFTYKEYKNITAAEVEKDNYTAKNMQYIRDVFGFALNKVCVVRIDTVGGTVAEALITLEKNIKTGWITIAEGTAAEFAILSSWIKSKEKERKSYKAVCYKDTAPDCKHIVNFYNDKVTFANDRGEATGEKYCPSLLGILASSNVTKSVTNFQCSNLARVVEVSDSEKAVSEGKLVLLNDVDTVRIALGNNSMTTTDGLNATEDMKFIDTVEVMDLINDDISDVFKNEYLGKYKNIYNNQILFISAINTYLKELGRDYILDPNYANKADVDVDAQRLAWIGTGKAEAEEWDDQTVKNNAFKRTVFLLGDIKISGAMENLKFVVNLV